MTEKNTNPDDSKKQPAKPKGFSGLILLALMLAVFFILVTMNMESGVSHSHYLFQQNLFAGNLTDLKIETGNTVSAKVKIKAIGSNSTPDTKMEVGRFEITFKNLGAQQEKLLKDISLWATNVKTNWADNTSQFISGMKQGKIDVSRAWHVFDQKNQAPMVYVLATSDTDGQIYCVLKPRGSDLLSLKKALKEQLVGVEEIPVTDDKTVCTVIEQSQLLPLLLTTIGPWIILIALIYFFFFRQMKSGPGGGVLSFGKSKAKLFNKETRTEITFADVAGVKEAKDEVSELVKFLKDPARFQRLGGRIPKGVLLVGSPGSGKTLLAKAIAGEAEVPFFSISGSDFVEMFVGVGASRVRDLFKQARENSPCLIFLDEVDAVGRKRGSGLGGGHDEREQTLNAILVEMDGFSTDEGIILIAATNRPDVLDPALMRPGRFDRQVTLDLPDFKGREAILKVHAKKVEMAEDVDLSVIAKATPSFSGADLAALINEAAILASIQEKDHVELEDLEEARDRIRWGREKRSRKIEKEDLETTAYHEAGHALAACKLQDVGELHKVTIIPRGMALGATMSLPEKDDYHMRRGKIKAMLVHLLAGRAAEIVCCDDISAGSENDIRQATAYAQMMVAEWGMSDKIGPISYTKAPEHNFLGRDFRFGKEHSEKVAYELDMEIKSEIMAAMKKAEKLCRDNQEILDQIKDALLKEETITGNRVKGIVNGETPPPVPPTNEGIVDGEDLPPAPTTEKQEPQEDEEAESADHQEDND